MSLDMIKKTYRNPALLATAKGRACVNCGIDDGTIVGAHGNEGKGMRIKASDSTVMFLCMSCHNILDNGKGLTREQRRQMAYEYNAKTLRILIEEGTLVLADKRDY